MNLIFTSSSIFIFNLARIPEMPWRTNGQVDLGTVGADRILIVAIKTLGCHSVLADAAVAQPRLDGLGVADHFPVRAFEAVPVLSRTLGKPARRAPEPSERSEIVIPLALELQTNVYLYHSCKSLLIDYTSERLY